MKLEKIKRVIKEIKASSTAHAQKLVAAAEQAKTTKALMSELKQTLESTKKALKATKKQHHQAVVARKKAAAALKDERGQLKKMEAKLSCKSSVNKDSMDARTTGALEPRLARLKRSATTQDRKKVSNQKLKEFPVP